jgi:hypothetical protein
LFSHKLCRWLVPFALAVMLATSLVLAREGWFYGVLAAGQVIVYITAAVGAVAATPPTGLRRIVTFFVIVNVSILHAWLNLAMGRRFVTWEPSRRGHLARQ